MIWKSFFDDEYEGYYYVSKIYKGEIQYICKVEQIILSADYILTVYFWDEKGDYEVLFTQTDPSTKFLMKRAEEEIEKL